MIKNRTSQFSFLRMTAKLYYIKLNVMRRLSLSLALFDTFGAIQDFANGHLEEIYVKDLAIVFNLEVNKCNSLP